jgi:hypothetical protein
MYTPVNTPRQSLGPEASPLRLGGCRRGPLLRSQLPAASDFVLLSRPVLAIVRSGEGGATCRGLAADWEEEGTVP